MGFIILIVWMALKIISNSGNQSYYQHKLYQTILGIGGPRESRDHESVTK